MDPLTHALGGALLAAASVPARPQSPALPVRTRLAAAGAAALFPDLDLALRLVDTLSYLNWHQGPTHAPLLLPAWAFALAHLFARVDPARHPWRSFYAPACLGLASHIAGDFITAYGLMLLAPLSTQRLALPLAFVVDPWISAILVAGLLGATRPRHGRVLARAALLALGAYVGFLGLQQQRALAVGEAYAAARALDAAAVHALPQPLSPLHWLLVVGDGERLHLAHLDLAAGAWSPPAAGIGVLRTLRAAYQPPSRLRWQQRGRFGAATDTALARRAWAQPALAGFRRFALFPMLEREEAAPTPCAWFVDLRFVLPGLPPSFRYGLCDEGRDWRLHRARGGFWID